MMHLSRIVCAEINKELNPLHDKYLNRIIVTQITSIKLFRLIKTQMQ